MANATGQVSCTPRQSHLGRERKQRGREGERDRDNDFFHTTFRVGVIHSKGTVKEDGKRDKDRNVLLFK